MQIHLELLEEEHNPDSCNTFILDSVFKNKTLRFMVMIILQLMEHKGHVNDLASAHFKALKYKNQLFSICLGIGKVTASWN